MEIGSILQNQYLAALEMLKQAIIQCPDSKWNEENIKGKCWHIAYHVLYYVHKNLQTTEHDFIPWKKHREHYQSLLKPSDPLITDPDMGEPYSKNDLLEYLTFCYTQVIENAPTIDLEGESGFPWFPFNKLELQIHSIRHIQHHTSQIAERLEQNAVDWVATKQGKS